jgi:adenylate cyclase class IV
VCIIQVNNIVTDFDIFSIQSGAKYIRLVYFLANNDPNVKGYCRVRCEIDRIFITVKIFDSESNFPQEYELELKIDETVKKTFEQAKLLLKALGLVLKAYHETYRELWSHDLVKEITFDTIPGIETYMEIDCKTEKNLNKVIAMLGLSTENMRHGGYDKTYGEIYGIPWHVINNSTPSLTFGNIANEIKPTKNQSLLEKNAAEQKILYASSDN